MSKIKKSRMIISATCKECGSTYAASLIYGGIEIDKEFTMMLAEADERGDTVKLTKDEEVVLGSCDCCGGGGK